MTSNRDITTVLRTLDPSSGIADPTSARARHDLQRILETDPTADQPSQPRSSPIGLSEKKIRPPRTTRPVRRMALAGGVLALTAGAVALPAVTGGDKAFASWTRMPTGMSASERTDSADSCRDQQRDGAGPGYADQLDSAQPAIAERRGVWTTVILKGRSGFSALCVTDSSSHLFARDMIGSVGAPTVDVHLGPRDLTAISLGSGTMRAGDISLAAGTAGSDVVGVVYRSRTHGDVAATVSGGYFALWFPGDELAGLPHDGVEVDVTYRDGSVGTARLSL